MVAAGKGGAAVVNAPAGRVGRNEGANVQYSASPLWAGMGYNNSRQDGTPIRNLSWNLGIAYGFGFGRPIDHDALRDDLLMQTAVGRVDALASSPTLSRMETRATRAQAVALHGVLVDQFIASHKTPPEELVLDIDASDVPLHGQHEHCEFRAYYDHHCYLPPEARIIVRGDSGFCRQRLLRWCERSGGLPESEPTSPMRWP